MPNGMEMQQQEKSKYMLILLENLPITAKQGCHFG